MRATDIPDGDEFAYADYSLDRTHVEVWAGHVFINLDWGTPLPLGPQLERAAPGLEVFHPEQTKVAARLVERMEANWKLVMENCWECYHCPGAHPQFCIAADVNALKESQYNSVTDASCAVPLVMEGNVALRPGMRTLSIDGGLVCRRLLGDVAGLDGARSGATAGFLLRHGTAVTYFEDYAIVLDYQPVDVGHTDLVARWLVADDAIEGRDYTVERLVEVFDITNRQDRELAELNQAGVQSSRYRPGPLSVANEAGVCDFHRFCDQCLADGPDG